ncbi:MAG: type II toxin-antitoxin system RelE/ParE family toxin [Bacteroidales bacterium]|nr:type II toxin-antitoxin system RelE/ParE family toxin [Bacteroidales bacterium]MCF8455472.1 type II toxin-antitoxin system RelE/ParE family toxin [Bacteroidales bacterium]
MRSGYSIHWTDHALWELGKTISFLEEYWTKRELIKFTSDLEHTIELISKHPYIFQVSIEKEGIRKAGVARYNSLYYRITENTVEILSLFSNRQDPGKIMV